MVTGQRHHWPDVFAPWRQWDRFRGDTTSNLSRWVYVSADLILIDVWLGLLQYAPEQKRWSNVCIPLGRCSDTYDSLHIEKDRWYTVPLLQETYFNGTGLRLVKETSWSWSHPSQSPSQKKNMWIAEVEGFSWFPILYIYIFSVSRSLNQKITTGAPAIKRHTKDRELGGEHRHSSCCSIGHCQCKLRYS